MRIFFVMFCGVVCFACSDNKAETAVKFDAVAPAPPPKYYFFPKANVYFDSANKEYVFLGNDGRSWQIEKQIPAAMQAIMDKSILVDSPSQPVWKDNENHKLVYSAVLYARPEDTFENKEKIIIEKPAAPDTVKKEKKGLGKFFTKLFGRKKKTNEPDQEN